MPSFQNIGIKDGLDLVDELLLASCLDEDPHVCEIVWDPQDVEHASALCFLHIELSTEPNVDKPSAQERRFSGSLELKPELVVIEIETDHLKDIGKTKSSISADLRL